MCKKQIFYSSKSKHDTFTVEIYVFRVLGSPLFLQAKKLKQCWSHHMSNINVNVWPDICIYFFNDRFFSSLNTVSQISLGLFNLAFTVSLWPHWKSCKNAFKTWSKMEEGSVHLSNVTVLVVGYSAQSRTFCDVSFSYSIK